MLNVTDKMSNLTDTTLILMDRIAYNRLLMQIGGLNAKCVECKAYS